MHLVNATAFQWLINEISLCNNQKIKNMAFEKGKSGNPNGKPPGIKNRNKKPLHTRIESLVLNNFERIEKDIEEVSPEVRLEIIANLAGLVNTKNQTA